VFEIVKWAVVVWLLLPIHKPLHGLNDFARVTLGIFLFVIFATKLLYDRAVQGGIRRRDTSRELLSIAGIVVAITFIVGIIVLLVGMLVANLAKSLLMPQE
jgi:ABC-type enterochelin transport system permease subunit